MAVATFTPGLYSGLLYKRWANADPYVEGDLVPNAMLWPNGTLATEQNVYNLILDSGIVSDAENLAGGVTIMADTDAVQWGSAKTWATTLLRANPDNLPMVVHIYSGAGRGQVRRITSYTDTQLTLSAPWTSNNIPMTPWTATPPNPLGWVTSNPCQYRIEYLDNSLPSKYQPNNLQGNDRLYLSLGDLYASVIVPALGPVPATTACPPTASPPRRRSPWRTSSCPISCRI